ncbi:hypothetical protein [Roseibium sp.]|uniref:hypothetical protein n=1 Tax=Roseibium sp. TaxID=1936156 RepID=UPI003D09AA50
MRTGSRLSLASLLLAPVMLMGTPALLLAHDYTLQWSDGTLIENNAEYAEFQAPYVKINGVELSRFAHMTRVEELRKLKVPGIEGSEDVHVFQVWQGGASQGLQLMAVTLSDVGVDVIGPLEPDFETIEIVDHNGDQGPLFRLYSADTNSVAIYEYFDGQMLRQK